MKNWTWQKWVGKIIALIIGIGGTIVSFLDVIPQWWAIIVAVLIVLEETLIGTFPTTAKKA